MRIATFNLENLGTPGRDGVDTAVRLDVMRPQMERLEADILCLQEVNGEKTPGTGRRGLAALDELIEGGRYEAYSRAHSVDPLNGRLAEKHNLVVLSRWPITATRQVWHDHVPAPSYRAMTAEPTGAAQQVTWDRPLLHCTIAPPGAEPLHVLNLHLRAPLAAPIAGQKAGPFSWKNSSAWAEGFYLAMLKRSGQALEARLEIDRVFDDDRQARIVVCGDFNAAEREVPARIIAAGVDDTANGQLAHRAMVFVERAVPPSQRFSVIHHGEKIMLDHIVISHALLASYRHLEVHNELIGDELFGFATIGENPESYHAPVVAAFSD